MFEWMKKTFPSAPENGEGEKKTTTRQTRFCKSCGKPIPWDPAWKFIPSYCRSCETKKQARRGMITITCRGCGRTFSLPESVQYWPNYCQECRAKAPAQMITRTCRGCGKEFSFLSTVQRWPSCCRDCLAKRKR